MSLETFAPVPREVTIGEVTVKVLPLRMRQLPAFYAAIAAAAPLIFGGRYAAAAIQHGDDVQKAIVVATDCEADWVGNLFQHDFLRLADAVFEVNMDFFVRLLPELRETAARMTMRLVQATGELSSPGLPSADTGSATASI